MITEKYCAGLVDSDGYIGFNIKKTLSGFKVSPRVTIKQRKDRSKVLYKIAEDWELNVYDDANTHCIVFTGNKALRFLERIKNHLVIKPDVAEFVSSINTIECSEDELKKLKEILRKLKENQKISKKNYPSRKWLAGYFDGDGSLQADKQGNLRLQFTSHNNEEAGIVLINKAFGGSIHRDKNTTKLYISLPYRYTRNKIDSVLGYFGKHCIIKKPQIEFVFGHAGKVSSDELYTKLKQLKLPASTK